MCFVRWNQLFGLLEKKYYTVFIEKESIIYFFEYLYLYIYILYLYFITYFSSLLAEKYYHPLYASNCVTESV